MGVAFYVAVCMLMWGLAIFIMKVAGERLDPFTMVLFNVFGYLIMGLVLFSRASYGWTRFHLMGVAVGILFVLGNMAFYKLSQTTQVTTLVPMTALHVAVPILLGFLILGEPMSLRKGAGILLALAAIYLLSSVEKPA